MYKKTIRRNQLTLSVLKSGIRQTASRDQCLNVSKLELFNGLSTHSVKLADGQDREYDVMQTVRWLLEHEYRIINECGAFFTLKQLN